MLHPRCGAVLITFLAAIEGGCATTETADSPTPSVSLEYGPRGVPQGPGVSSEAVDAELVYEPEPPVYDFAAYPAVVYDGATVYYIGGLWYRETPHGWAHYRGEPSQLGRERRIHERDPRWARARVPTRSGVTEAQPPDRPAAPPPQPQRQP
jgi:hypothetical protein